MKDVCVGERATLGRRPRVWHHLSVAAARPHARLRHQVVRAAGPRRGEPSSAAGAKQKEDKGRVHGQPCQVEKYLFRAPISVRLVKFYFIIIPVMIKASQASGG